MKLRKVTAIITAAVMMMSLAACGSSDKEGGSDGGSSSGGSINVISREEGSGTRGAFVELFGVEEEVQARK